MAPRPTVASASAETRLFENLTGDDCFVVGWEEREGKYAQRDGASFLPEAGATATTTATHTPT